MKRRGDFDDDVPALDVGPAIGHYTTGFSARIEDGVPQEPVSTVGPIGFLTKPLTRAALRRLNARKRGA